MYNSKLCDLNHINNTTYPGITHIVQGPYDLIIQAYTDFFEANGSLEKQKKNNQQSSKTCSLLTTCYMYIHIFSMYQVLTSAIKTWL